MTAEMFDQLSRLERRIMDAVYRLGEAPVADVVDELGEPGAYDSIRVTMSNLEKKGFLKHRREGIRNIYAPTVAERKARTSAVRHLVRTFFDGSPSGAILGLLDMSRGALSEHEIDEIQSWIGEMEGSARHRADIVTDPGARKRRNRILGAFEQVVLLGVLQAGDGALGLDVRRVLEENLGRRVSRGAFYTTVDRLANEGYLDWEIHEGGDDRQGLPERRFAVTPAGLEALRQHRAVVSRLTDGLEEVLGPI